MNSKKPTSDSEAILISELLKEIVPENRLSDDLMGNFLEAYREGEDVSTFLLQEVGRLLRESDSELSRTNDGIERLQNRVRTLEQISDDLKSSLHELTLLEELAFEEWGGSQELPEVLESFMNLLMRCVPTLAIRIYLINEQNHAFEVAAERNLTAAQRKESEERLDEGTFAWAIREGGPVALPLDDPDGCGTSLIVAPLLTGRRPLGILCLFSSLQDADFTPHIFQIFRGLIQRTSISIANARRSNQLLADSQRLSGMKDYLSLIVDTMIQGVLVIEPNDRVAIFNRTAELIFGRERSEVLGLPFSESLPTELTAPIAELVKRARRDDPVVDYEFDFNRGEGVAFRLGVTTSQLADEQGRPHGVVLTFRDLFTANELMRLRQRERFQNHAITQFRSNLREAEERLRRSEKLASIGQMAAGVAHEINNPLGSIAGFLQLILMDCSAEDPNRTYLDAMQREVERMKRIVEDLLDFSRQKKSLETQMLPVDLPMVLQDTLRLLEPQIHLRSVQVTCRTDESLPSVLGLADRLKQVLINIILNACHAMDKEEHHLLIELRRTERDQRTWVEIACTDNGQGIRNEDLKRIFDPFFTTREQGQGTGLGLATCYGIIEHHGGEIRVDSIWGEGSTFTVALPVQEESSYQPGEEDDPSAESSSSEDESAAN